MRQDLKQTFLWSLGLALLLTLALAQGKPAPGPNQAFLYEMSENAVLKNPFDHVLVPDPTGTSLTGLIDSVTGKGGIPDGLPVRRVATSQLQGVASLGTLLCPAAVLITVPKAKECTVTSTGTTDRN